MIYLKTDEEIELMRSANQLVGRTLGELAKHIAPGVTTLQLDKIAEEFIRDNGASEHLCDIKSHYRYMYTLYQKLLFGFHRQYIPPHQMPYQTV